MNNLISKFISGRRGEWYYCIDLCEDVTIQGGYFYHKHDAIAHARGNLLRIITEPQLLIAFLTQLLRH